MILNKDEVLNRDCPFLARTLMTATSDPLDGSWTGRNRPCPMASCRISNISAVVPRMVISRSFSFQDTGADRQEGWAFNAYCF
ncbi:MAG: hypothetical protein A2277_17105 [Desulfobacterales bacterium RIFOXYA12_FULL_46_15]|nr:MAG: hypothetical protein A2277_17105 [Desulfobacterales bacterium RIFOXYA12_FULL_46_15]